MVIFASVVALIHDSGMMSDARNSRGKRITVLSNGSDGLIAISKVELTNCVLSLVNVLCFALACYTPIVTF